MLSFQIYGFLLFIFELITINNLVSAINVDTLQAKGTAALASGHFSEALSFYTDAFEIDSKNYLIVYRIATVHIAMGNLKMASPFIDMTLKLNPTFIPAKKQKGNIQLKFGEFEEAFNTFESLRESDAESMETISKLAAVRKVINVATEKYENKEFSEAIPLLVQALEVSTMNVALHDMLADCYLGIHDFIKGIQELRKSSHIKHDDLARILRIAELSYDHGMMKPAYEEISQCLRLDQDNKECRHFYKKIKNEAKLFFAIENSSETEKWLECFSKAKQFLSMVHQNEEYSYQANNHICHCGSRIGTNEALESCDKVIAKDPSSLGPYFDKAKTYMNLNQLDEALAEYQKILKRDSNNNQAQDGVKKVQRLIKQASKRDYYKILGVSRTASNSEILKAYRKLAAEFHPDRVKNDSDKQNAKKKFLDIAAAKEVLTNSENRAKFDSGIDPLDAENQGGGGGNPFAHGGPFGFTFQNFNPFEGGNFEFHFG